MIRLLSVLAIILAAFLEVGAVESADRVVELKIEGNRRVQKEAVIRVIATKVGSTYSRDTIRNDIRSLYAMDHFKDIQIDVEDAPGGKRVIYRLVEREYLDRLVIEGNQSVKSSDIEEKLALKFPMLADETKIKEALEKVRKLYKEKGFYLTKISSEIETVDQETRLKIVVVEGTRIAVKRINIIGNRKIQDSAIKEIMITREEGALSLMTGSGRFDEELFLDADVKRIQFLYLQNGFADIRVERPKAFLAPDGKSLMISIVLDEGPQYRVGEVDVAGDLDFIEDKAAFMREKLKLKPGDIWDIRNQQEDAQTVQDIYGERGYAYANVEPQMTKNSEELLLNVTYTIGKGALVHFGFVDIIGNMDTRDRVIRRELKFVEGELFNITKFRTSKRNLERLGYFEEVKFVQKDRIEEQKIDVTIEVKEKSTGSIQLGATFSSFDAFGGFVQLQKINLFGLGYDINMMAQLSKKSQLFNLEFRNPRVYDTYLSMTINGYNRQFTNPDGSVITERGGGLSFSYPLIEDLYYLGWSYRLEDVGLDYPTVLTRKFPDSEGLNSEVGLSISRDTLDVRHPFLPPSSGSNHKIATELSTRYVGSDMSYWRLSYTGRKYFTLFKDTLPVVGSSVLAFVLRAGYVQGIDGRRVPFGERYFPGGLFTIRGHFPRSLGPEIDTPYPITGRDEDELDPYVAGTRELKIGGNKQVIFNAEYLFNIFREANIKGVIFFDAGNAYIEGELPTFSTLRYSAGFGVRWFSPIGPLRFEWGFPIDKKADEGRVQFDFSIGSPF